MSHLDSKTSRVNEVAYPKSDGRRILIKTNTSEGRTPCLRALCEEILDSSSCINGILVLYGPDRSVLVGSGGC